MMMSTAGLESRTRLVRKGRVDGKCVCYWMSREQRVEDNQALVFAVATANKLGLPVQTLFSLSPSFIGAARRHYDFMLDGLIKVEVELARKVIGFKLVLGDPSKMVPDFLSTSCPAVLITDFDPLKAKRSWREEVCKETDMTIYEVDAHNIVPSWLASNKREWGAATLRRKLVKLLPDFLVKPPMFSVPKVPWRETHEVDWKKVRSTIRAVDYGAPITWIESGSEAALDKLESFISEGLSGYPDQRNDPNKKGQSDLSPYLHFGQISPQRVAWEVSKADAPQPSKQAFLEELIVRRELSDNFCLHTPDYDSVSGFPDWSKATLEQHRFDEREYVYSAREFEEAKTHDKLWNAAQNQMVRQGKMHGYIRMYWAKKILEWSETPEEAMRIAILLNDRYELDGRDPNGYAGIAWSIGGVHDRAWPSHKILGKIRYMSFGGAKSKFDVESYVSRWS
jgi:deoxyribodipyrimidine photo-lyase